jgi:hypothetical protein
MNQIQVPTSTVPSWVHLATAIIVPLSVHVTLLTYCSLDTSCCIPFRTLSITHNSAFLDDHSISRISTQQWISRNLFTFEPMLIVTFLLNYGLGITRRILCHRFWDTCVYRVAQKKCIRSLLINIFGIKLNEIYISGWECNIIYNSRTSFISIFPFV